MINTTNIAELEKEKAKLKQKTTSQLIQEADMSSAFSFDGALRLRYDLHYVSKNDFKSTINTLRAKDADAGNKIVGVITFAKDDAESVEIGRLIKDAVADDTYRMIFIDASINPLGTDLFEQYVDAMANSVINLKSDRGVVFLGNIETDNMDEYKNMLTELPSLFQESALLDRMHGFIKGWDIPPMQPGLKISGWALNTEYFCTVLHLLREDMSYRAIVDQIVEVSDGAYERHVEAVKKLTTAFLKLLFPHVKSVEDINRLQFKTYCLQPAVKMRKIVQLQLEELDPKEYKKEEKQMPTFSLRKDV